MKTPEKAFISGKPFSLAAKFTIARTVLNVRFTLAFDSLRSNKASRNWLTSLRV